MINRKKLKDAALGLGKKDEIEDPNATEEQKISLDSKTSYFTLKQYNVLNKRIMEANYRIKEQQTMIDSLDKTVADTLNKIRKKLRRDGNQSDLSHRSGARDSQHL